MGSETEREEAFAIPRPPDYVFFCRRGKLLKVDKRREARRTHWGCGACYIPPDRKQILLWFYCPTPCLLSFGPRGPIFPRSEKVQFGGCGGPLPVLKGSQLQAALSYPSIYERTSDNRGKEGRKGAFLHPERDWRKKTLAFPRYFSI